MERVECIVIGAGAVGLAVARALATKGREVIVLEAEDAIGTQTSSRNSEVIHAGLYYTTGSLKARLCVEGKHKRGEKIPPNRNVNRSAPRSVDRARLFGPTTPIHK